VAVGVTAIVLLGPGQPRAAIGARVWGIAGEGARRGRVRIEGVRRHFGVDDASPSVICASRCATRTAIWGRGRARPARMGSRRLSFDYRGLSEERWTSASSGQGRCSARGRWSQAATPLRIAPAKIPGAQQRGDAIASVEVMRAAPRAVRGCSPRLARGLRAGRRVRRAIDRGR
jgi:hypothetical protein